MGDWNDGIAGMRWQWRRKSVWLHGNTTKLEHFSFPLLFIFGAQVIFCYFQSLPALIRSEPLISSRRWNSKEMLSMAELGTNAKELMKMSNRKNRKCLSRCCNILVTSSINHFHSPRALNITPTFILGWKNRCRYFME